MTREVFGTAGSMPIKPIKAGESSSLYTGGFCTKTPADSGPFPYSTSLLFQSSLCSCADFTVLMTFLFQGL